MSASDPHDLQRFVDAQQPLYAQVRAELVAGSKTSHWMWFIFPQLRALGRSATARRFGLAGLDEAQAYAAHPLLGPRLVDCSQLVLQAQGRSVEQIFGVVDAMKLCSCMTLFERAAGQPAPFGQVLDRFYLGRRDDATLALLA